MMNGTSVDIAAAPVTSRVRSKEELLTTISASRLGTWLSCRLKFYFRYLAGVPKPPSPAMRVGTVIHAVLQQWSLARWRKAPLKGDMVRTVFDQAWVSAQTADPLDWQDDEDAVKAGALATVEAYLRDTPIPLNERPEGVEVSVEKNLEHLGLPTLVGVIDLVRQGGRIVDFKTTSRTPDPDQVRHTTEVQTTAYSLLYREATDRVESGIELHHLVRLKTPKLVVTQIGPATAQQEHKLLRLIDSYLRGVASEDFTPAPGLQCAMCEFFDECQNGH
jgi:CRISPR/Cas system-associated exonuclease Cas4 (RecB family)